MAQKRQPKKKKSPLCHYTDNALIFSSLLFTTIFAILIAVVNQYRTITHYQIPQNASDYITYNDTTISIKNALGKTCYIRQPQFVSSLKMTTTSNPYTEKFAFRFTSQFPEKQYVFDKDIVAITAKDAAKFITVKPNNLIKIKKGIPVALNDFFIIEKANPLLNPTLATNDGVYIKSVKTEKYLRYNTYNNKIYADGNTKDQETQWILSKN